MKAEFRKLPVALGIIMLIAISGLGFFTDQSDFGLISGGYLIAFSIYFFIWRTAETKDLPFYLGLALLLRFVLIFAFPQLSDDIYRFIWDGRLITHGYNPFNFLPSQIIAEGWAEPWLNQELYNSLNSQSHYTIYPPVAQFNFAVATWLFPNSTYGSMVVMKIWLFAFEAGTLLLLPKLLRQLDLPAKNSLLYALNPLVLIEIMGNLHFEGAMIFFLILGLSWLINGKLFKSATAVALSIASKLLPLLFLMFFIKRLGWKKALKYFTVVGLTLLLLFAPLLNEVFFVNFGNSLDLYFQQFEFNASIYYVVRAVGYYFSGYNLIHYLGPVLAGFTFLGITITAFREKEIGWQRLMNKMLFAICLYLSFSPIVHPWYVLLPLVLSVFTRFRFVVIWSGLITLTYINYYYGVYHENLWVVALEYSVVISWGAYELFRPKLLTLKS